MNTSNREIPIKGSNGHEYVRFADWEEMPPTLDASISWNRIAYAVLNKKEPTEQEEPRHILEGPTQRAMYWFINIKVGWYLFQV